jgi:hypothetical protein
MSTTATVWVYGYVSVYGQTIGLTLHVPVLGTLSTAFECVHPNVDVGVHQPPPYGNPKRIISLE